MTRMGALVTRDGSQVILAGALGPEYLRKAAKAAEDFDRSMLQVRLACAATDEMIRNRITPILERFVRQLQQSQRRREQRAARERRRRRQQCGQPRR